MTELLRECLRQAPSLREVTRATGCDTASLSRFVHGETSLRLDKADALAEYFGIESKLMGRTRRKVKEAE